MKLFGYISLALVLVLPSCTKHKNPTGQGRQASTATTLSDSVSSAPLPTLRPVLLPDSIAQRLTPTYAYCEGKFRCLLESPGRRLPFTLQFKTWRKDRTTFMLLGPFGVPVATGWIRADSVYFANKLDGTKIKQPLSSLQELTGLPPDLAMVESVLSGSYTLPAHYVPTLVQDTLLQAHPLPAAQPSLTLSYTYKCQYPSYIEFKDEVGKYYIRNTSAPSIAGPASTILVQEDSAGIVQTRLKMEVLSRKFEK